MGSVVAKHNKKILRNSSNAQPKPRATCNCQKKEDCPVPGECNQDGAIYQATVSSAGGREETYVGLAKNFKRRYPKHKKNILDESAPNGTSLSKYFWKETNLGRDPKITWKFLERNVPVFNPITNK